jgi:hypothetical protein
MHSFHLKKLPLSFAEMWQTNLERNPECALRSANDYFIPAHRVETVKRTAWNSSPGDKFNAKQHLYLKNLKELIFIRNLVVNSYFSLAQSYEFIYRCIPPHCEHLTANRNSPTVTPYFLLGPNSNRKSGPEKSVFSCKGTFSASMPSIRIQPLHATDVFVSSTRNQSHKHCWLP